VANVSVSLEKDAASLEYEGERVTATQMEQAVQRVVLLPRVRHALERAAHPFHRRGR
jgi:copper chaperone CopZ